MSPKTLDSRHAIESCTFHLHSWKPFHPQPKTLDPDYSPKTLHTKRQCRADRATCSLPIEALDMSKLALFDDDRDCPLPVNTKRDNNNLRLIAGKRRRRGSRSVSGRSSDRSGTRRRCCSVGASAAYGTCSDFPIAVGTDSSGELFVSNGDTNWLLDVSSEVARTLRKEKENGVGGDRENCHSSFIGQVVVGESSLGNESGYGSEPGYRGDAEFGYGDELDEEEDDQWGDEFGVSKMEKVGENTLQKVHHRCRRRKQDCKMVIP